MCSHDLWLWKLCVYLLPDYGSCVSTCSLTVETGCPPAPWLWKLCAHLLPDCVSCVSTCSLIVETVPTRSLSVETIYSADCRSCVPTCCLWLWKLRVNLPPAFRGNVHTASCYYHRIFPIVISCSLNFWAKISPSLCGIRYSVTAMKKVNNSFPNVTQLAGRKARV